MTIRALLKNRDAPRLFLDRHLLLRPGSGPGRGAESSKRGTKGSSRKE